MNNESLPELPLIANKKMKIYSSASITANPLLAAVQLFQHGYLKMSGLHLVTTAKSGSFNVLSISDLL